MIDGSLSEPFSSYIVTVWIWMLVLAVHQAIGNFYHNLDLPVPVVHLSFVMAAVTTSKRPVLLIVSVDCEFWVKCIQKLEGHCDVPWRDVMAADLCWTLFVADCYCGAGDGELLAYLLWCIRLFGLELWSILDVVNSRNSVKFRSYVLLVVLALVYSGLDFSRCQRSI